MSHGSSGKREAEEPSPQSKRARVSSSNAVEIFSEDMLHHLLPMLDAESARNLGITTKFIACYLKTNYRPTRLSTNRFAPEKLRSPEELFQNHAENTGRSVEEFRAQFLSTKTAFDFSKTQHVSPHLRDWLDAAKKYAPGVLQSLTLANLEIATRRSPQEASSAGPQNLCLRDFSHYPLTHLRLENFGKILDYAFREMATNKDGAVSQAHPLPSHLTTLTVKKCQNINGSSLEHLVHFPKLTHLEISNCGPIPYRQMQGFLQNRPRDENGAAIPPLQTLYLSTSQCMSAENIAALGVEFGLDAKVVVAQEHSQSGAQAGRGE